MSVQELLAVFEELPEEQKTAVRKDANTLTGGLRWVPNPGPQTDAYFSEADVLLFGGEPGGGKDLALDTLLPTPSGWTTMGAVKIGDFVFDETGVPCRVVAKSEIFNRPAYRIVFSDGAQVVAGPGHEWLTKTEIERDEALKFNAAWRAKRRATRPSRAKGNKSAAFTAALKLRNTQRAAAQVCREPSCGGVRTTQAMYDTLLSKRGALNHSVAVAGALSLPRRELPIDPYLLGLWLGDGQTSAARLCMAEDDVVALATSAANRNGWRVTKGAGKYDYGVVGGMKAALRKSDVLGNKHIPTAYLRAAMPQRLALLQGLMDTDGHVNAQGQCEIQLTCKPLIDGVCELLVSLGIKVQMREGMAKLYGRVIGPKWRLKFITDLPVFQLSRKAARQKRAEFRGTHNQRYVTSIVPVSAEPTQCIQVDSPNHMYLCTAAMVPTHNSQLLLGLAFNEHKRTLIMRRQYGDLDRLVEDALVIHGSREGFNGSPPPKLRINDTQVINFAAAHRIGDEQSQMGKGRDLLGIDEATHFAESQVRFLMGWNRSEDPNQRVRTVLATNPPLTPEGLWVVKMFAPWLDPAFPNPAKPGELRWVISNADGDDEWVCGSDPVIRNGVEYRPLSRTFIPSGVEDNPEYAESDYKRQLEAMPEPFRSMLLGGFRTEFRDNPNQAIPTTWITMAQARWTREPPNGVPMCALAADATGGGNDPMVVAMRHDGWFAPLLEIPAKDIPVEKLGQTAAGIVVANRRDMADVVVDMGGGYGIAMYGILKTNGVSVFGYKGSEKYTGKTRDGSLAFYNTRSAALWRLREALDPGQPGGSQIMLPPDKMLAADLAAPLLDMEYNGIKVESKEKVCERLGRSTDRGDAVIMAWWKGLKNTNVQGGFSAYNTNRKPQVVMGRQANRR